MTEINEKQNRTILQKIAKEAMIERGLLPDFPPDVLAELNAIPGPPDGAGESFKDLTGLPWCSIDNDDSRDLDQLTVSLTMPSPSDSVKILVAIADVDSVVKKQSAIDIHASHNTTSVYTPAVIFPMLPERISTDLTSLNLNENRLAIIIEMVVDKNGEVQGSDIYRAMVRNKAKLAYNSVAAWLDGRDEIPGDISKVSTLADNILKQYEVSLHLKALRHERGALNFDTVKARPLFEGQKIKGIEIEKSNSAKDLIEDFMIAANGVTACFLESKKFPSIQRVVRSPKRWARIVEIAAERNYSLPAEPDSKALDQFLVSSKAADPDHFPDLSLSVLKLLGAGEYVVEIPGEEAIGHFGLAVRDYSHSTAPNRRYPDLITQRLLKAAIGNQPVPYTSAEMTEIALHCNEAESSARKVERQVDKSAGVIVMESRIGDLFDAIVTGASAKGTWVRLLYPPVDGKLVNPPAGTDIGEKVRVKLVHTDLEKGFIDFKIAP